MNEDPFSKVHALILEDNAHMASILKDMVRSFGIRTIYESRDAAQAFEMMRDHFMNLAIVDQNLGDIEGTEFTKLVRMAPDSPNPNMQIVMVTAHGDRRTVTEALRSGVNEFLVKPVRPADLHKKLRSCILSPRQFVRTKTYYGPDRRRRQDQTYKGPWRRNDDPPS